MAARLRTQRQINEQTQQLTLQMQNGEHDIGNDQGWWKYIQHLNPKEWACCIYRFISDLLSVYETKRSLQIKEKENEELKKENIILKEKNEALARLSQLVSVKLRDNNPTVVDLNDCYRPTKLTEMFSELYDNEWTAAFMELEEEAFENRLSQLVSVKLRDNNQNIVELSDPYRPMKLAEMFSELYDNEWTAAFMELEEEAFEDRHVIEILRNILMVSYAFCAKTLEENRETVSQWYFDKNSVTAKQTANALKDGRKVLIPNHFGKIQKEFCEHLFNICNSEKLKKLLQRDSVKSYISKCCQLSLLMNATDPPLVMKCESDTEKRTGGRDMYNKDMFKEYTTRGKYFDFCTWPVLFLHEDGPMLSKGVAQGVNDPDVKDMGKAKTWFRLKF